MNKLGHFKYGNLESENIGFEFIVYRGQLSNIDRIRYKKKLTEGQQIFERDMGRLVKL